MVQSEVVIGTDHGFGNCKFGGHKRSFLLERKTEYDIQKKQNQKKIYIKIIAEKSAFVQQKVQHSNRHFFVDMV